MRTRELGKTGMRVNPIGIGLAEIGFELSADQTDIAGRVLNTALDSGINFLDTPGCYSISEELIGGTVSTRRGEYFLASKIGQTSAPGSRSAFPGTRRSDASPLGFTLHHSEVSVAIVGTKSTDHVKSNLGIGRRLEPSDAFVSAAHRRFDELGVGGGDWEQRG